MRISVEDISIVNKCNILLHTLDSLIIFLHVKQLHSFSVNTNQICLRHFRKFFLCALFWRLYFDFRVKLTQLQKPPKSLHKRRKMFFLREKKTLEGLLYALEDLSEKRYGKKE